MKLYTEKQVDRMMELAKFSQNSKNRILFSFTPIEIPNDEGEEKLFTEDDVRKAIVMSATSPTDNLIDRCDKIIKHIKQSKK